MSAPQTYDAGVSHQIGRYSDAIRVPADYDLMVVSGTPGLDENGNIPADFADEARQVWRNVAAILEKAGASLSDIVSIRQYLTREEDIKTYVAVQKEMITHEPAAMLLVPTAMACPEIHVEVEAVAVVHQAADLSARINQGFRADRLTAVTNQETDSRGFHDDEATLVPAGRYAGCRPGAAGDANVAVDETFTAAERIQLDSTSRAAITSAVNVVTSGRSNSRPACASCSDIYFAYAGCAVAGVDSVRGRSDRDRDPRGLLLWRHRAKSPLSDGLEPVLHLGELPLWPGRTSCPALRHDRCLRGVLAVDQPAREGARAGRSERIALWVPASRNQQYTAGVDP